MAPKEPKTKRVEIFAADVRCAYQTTRLEQIILYFRLLAAALLNWARCSNCIFKAHLEAVSQKSKKFKKSTRCVPTSRAPVACPGRACPCPGRRCL